MGIDPCVCVRESVRGDYAAVRNAVIGRQPQGLSTVPINAQAWCPSMTVGPGDPQLLLGYINKAAGPVTQFVGGRCVTHV